MHFKLIHILKKLELTFPEDGRIELESAGVKIEIRPLTEEEQEKYKRTDLLYCEARTTRHLQEELRNVFSRLLENRMPEGFKKPAPESRIHPDRFPNVDDLGNILPKSSPSIELFPDYFKTFYLDVLHELTESIRNAVRVLRWRLGIKGAHYPVESTLGMKWSLSGKKWRNMPYDFVFRFEMNLVPQLEADVYDDVKTLHKAGANEPLAHELFLEAWELKNANPRSALVVGVAAAEVGFKQFVGGLVPDAKWLVEHSPTPPLHAMIVNYLPLMPARAKIRGQVLPPPKSVRKAIHAGVELRNKTAHAGQMAPPSDELSELLLAIRDFLYLLDFYSGHKWAEKHIRRETLDEIRQEFRL